MCTVYAVYVPLDEICKFHKFSTQRNVKGHVQLVDVSCWPDKFVRRCCVENFQIGQWDHVCVCSCCVRCELCVHVVIERPAAAIFRPIEFDSCDLMSFNLQKKIQNR